jgi:hypothetical protein
MTKFVQALLSGIFFTFLLDVFLFLGIKLHYIDYHSIDLYYNILFADHQNIYIFAFFTFLIGLIITYVDNTKTSLIVVGSFFLIASSTFITPIGKKVGEIMLMKTNITFKDKKHTYIGDSYYNGRKFITFYDYELNKVIILDKKRLVN